MRVPSYRKHSSGNARVTIKGKDYLLGLHGSVESKRRYEQLIAEYLANGFIKSGDSDGLAMSEIMTAYLQYAALHCSHNEVNEFKLVATQVVDYYGESLASEFSVSQFRVVRMHMAEKGWLRNTVNRRMQRLLQMLKWATTEEMFDVNRYNLLRLVEPLKKGRCECKESEPIEPVSERDLKTVLKRVSPVLKTMIQLQRLTGARPAEVCRLRPCDIDRSSKQWKSKLAEHKTAHHKKSRTVVFGPAAQNLLAKYLLRSSTAFCFSPTESHEWYLQQAEAMRTTPKGYGNSRGSNRVKNPIRSPGTMFTTDSYRRAIHRACDAAGIAKWSPNQIRHLRATEVSKEFGIEAAQIMLGHSSIKTTEIYAERDLSKLEAIMEKIG